MRSVSIFVALLAASILPGCPRPERIDTRPTSTVRARGLAVTIDIPTRQVVVGDRFNVVVAAENTTDQPIRIVARSGAPVYLTLLRHTGLGWEEVKRYPQAVAMVMSPWTLQRRSTRRFVIPLTVEPDWPTGEILSVVAELNGWPDANPRLTFEAFPAETPGPG